MEFAKPSNAPVSMPEIIVLCMIFTFLIPLTAMLCMMTVNATRGLLKNETTIESLELENISFAKEARHIYNLGIIVNIKQVFNGYSGLIVPRKMNGDGHYFRTVD
jgi:hypothetical protein